MIYKINSILFYLSFFAFIGDILAYFTGFLEVIDAINYALLVFGFICLFLGMMLTKNAPPSLKVSIVGLIGVGATLWLLSILKLLPFAIFWKYGMLLIFSGIIWAIWNKVFPKGSFFLKVIFGLSAFSLILTTLLTCFSFFDNSSILFYSLLIFTISSMVIILNHKSKKQKKY